MDEPACVGVQLLGNHASTSAQNDVRSSPSESSNVYHHHQHQTTRESNNISHWQEILRWRWVDFLVTMLIIGPLTVAYWRGTWSLMNVYLFPNNDVISAWASFAIGTSVILMLNFCQGNLTNRLTRRQDVLFHVLLRIYIYVFGFSVVNHWRGCWYVLDAHTNVTVLSAVISVVVPLPILLALRACGNLVASPGVILVDFCDAPFRIGTRFAAEASFSWAFAGDVVLTVVIIGSLVVVSWRGLWLLFDIFLFQTDPEHSSWTSVGIGYGTLVLLALLETPVSNLLRKTRELFPRIVLEDIFKLAAWLGVLSVWRGLWLVCDYHILPDRPVQSYLLTHVVGIGGLYLMQAGRSVLVAGCVVDGDTADGTGVRMGRYLEQVCPKLVRLSTEQVSDQRCHSDWGQQTTSSSQDVVHYETSL
ncbi:PREDICTED: uncharacterized protein LOC109466790 [Branchiostoma belcheri]|uniref:Uncharacterized protein LOC109466790 n=1 Tax=Branchiostoma belcheri TaxID=7741 RepID=A0A6P4Y6Y2_BRABE|nr:PREDICTED: uncharacterized protein LOC109466790 [Branchiostoma belcheri]